MCVCWVSVCRECGVLGEGCSILLCTYMCVYVSVWSWMYILSSAHLPPPQHKCHTYWAELNEEVMFGEILIKTVRGGGDAVCVSIHTRPHLNTCTHVYARAHTYTPTHTRPHIHAHTLCMRTSYLSFSSSSPIL